MMTPALAMAFLMLPLAALAFRLLQSQRDAKGIRQLFVQVVAGSLIFGVIGPLIGVFVFTVFSRELLFEGIESFSSSFGILLFLAYFLGGLPALLTGVVAGALKPWLKSWLSFAGIGLVGLMLLLLWRGAILNPFGLNFGMAVSWAAVDEQDFQMVISGFVAGVLSARVMCGWSCKPAPAECQPVTLSAGD